MERRTINAPDAPAPAGGYSQAVEVLGARRLLFISGQIPVEPGGELPSGFRDQCRKAWANIEAQLRAAGLDLTHLVKVTTFLADRSHAIENRDVRAEVLGDLKPALTVIIAGIFDSEWLIEIEAIAAA
jgi:2-iminobutanoate/2-iminopropanoate deaminase